MPAPSIEPRGLRRPQAAAYLGVSPSYFDSLRDRLPAPRRLDGVVVWDRHDLDVFFDGLPSEASNDNENPWDEVLH